MVYSNPEIKLLAVKRMRLGPWWRYGNLTAPYWRLYHHDAPGASVALRGETFEMPPECLCLIPPDTPFQSDCEGNPAQLFIHFLASEPYSFLMASEIFIIWPGPKVLRLAEQAMELLGSSAPWEDGRLPMLALSLVSFSLTHIPPEQLSRSSGLDHRVAVAMRTVDTATAPISNSELARRAGMSVNAFGRLFKHCTGVTLQAYSRKKRLDQACLRLRFSSLGIKEIAEGLGFCDRHHFAKLFKKERGVSPGEYRRGEREGR